MSESPLPRPYLVPAPAAPTPGPFWRCPHCDAPAARCDDCGTQRTDGALHSRHDGCPCGKSSYFGRESPLAFTHNTHEQALCSPFRRRRFGFLWLRRCREPGTHYHQQCQRCGWRGTSPA